MHKRKNDTWRVREDSGQLPWRTGLLDNGLRPSVNRPVLNRPVLNRPVLNRPVLNRSVINRSVINPFRKELPMVAVKELQRKVRENRMSQIYSLF
jgi:hypothetical protein